MLLGRDVPPGSGTMPGRGGVPGRDGLPRRGAPRGRRDAPPGPAPGFAERDGAGPDAGRPGRRAGARAAVVDPATTEDRPGRGSRAARSGARASRRRVRTLLLAVLVLAVLAAGAVAALKFVSRDSSRSHVLVAPSRLASYVRRPELEQQMNARALQQQVIAKSAGQASHVVSAVYENSAGVAGTAPPQIFLFIGGNLAGESPAGFISSFTAQFKGAQATSAGSLGGQAACVDARGSAAGSVALCTWADGDTFGVVASPTMTLSELAAQMRAIRPSVELPAR